MTTCGLLGRNGHRLLYYTAHCGTYTKFKSKSLSLLDMYGGHLAPFHSQFPLTISSLQIQTRSTRQNSCSIHTTTYSLLDPVPHPAVKLPGNDLRLTSFTSDNPHEIPVRRQIIPTSRQRDGKELVLQLLQVDHRVLCSRAPMWVRSSASSSMESCRNASATNALFLSVLLSWYHGRPHRYPDHRESGRSVPRVLYSCRDPVVYMTDLYVLFSLQGRRSLCIDARPSVVMYASPHPLQGYLTTYVNFCWGIGQVIGVGVVKSQLGRLGLPLALSTVIDVRERSRSPTIMKSNH